MINRLPRIRPWNRWLRGPTMPAEVLDVRTRDGLMLKVHRVRPARGHGPAVMLLHGLSSNRHALHFPGRSLAGWLADLGYDCYVPELRGAGQSERPPPNWTLDAYFAYDLPAVIEAIRAASRQDQIHWVGHSLGGLLLLCYGILNPHAPIRSGTSIGAGLDYRIGYTSFRHLLAIRLLLERLPAVPYGTMIHFAAPLLGRRLSTSLDTLTAWPANIEPEVYRRIQALCFHSVPVSLLGSLSMLFSRRGLRTDDRSTFFLEDAPRFRIPLQLIGGTEDLQISADAVRDTATLVNGPTRVQIHGRDYGDAEEYGHWDLILGRRAPVEIWPEVAEWLALQERARVHHCGPAPAA